MSIARSKRTRKSCGHLNGVGQPREAFTDTFIYSPQVCWYHHVSRADCNPREFMDQSSLGEARRSFLRTFFGYLTSALCFLHDNRIRRKDTKPQNVLVKAHHVLLTDFGNSTTSGPTPLTPRYCALEVSDYSRRNSLSDIWSLGCVFFEMWTVLRAETVQEMLGHLEPSGSMSSCCHLNYA